MKNNEINAFNESTNYYNKISDQAIKKFGSIHKKEALEFIAKNNVIFLCNCNWYILFIILYHIKSHNGEKRKRIKK